MGHERVWVWVCDECGHKWLDEGVVPKQCPARGCRSRKWDEKAHEFGSSVAADGGGVSTGVSAVAGDRSAVASEVDTYMARQKAQVEKFLHGGIRQETRIRHHPSCPCYICKPPKEG